MTPDQKKMLRDALLAALVISAPLSLPFARLKAAAKAMAFELPDDELAREIDYLVKSGLVTVKAETLSAGAKRYESTAKATDYCESEGIV